MHAVHGWRWVVGKFCQSRYLQFKCLHLGATDYALLKELGVGKSTISDIKRSEGVLLLRRTALKVLWNEACQWFQARWCPVSLIFPEMISGSTSFRTHSYGQGHGVEWEDQPWRPAVQGQHRLAEELPIKTIMVFVSLQFGEKYWVVIKKA